MKIGKQIKATRTRKKVKQADLAKYLGISRSQLSEIENEKDDIDELKLEMVADFFGMNVPQLTGEAPAREAIQKPEAEVFSEIVDSTEDETGLVLPDSKKIPRQIRMLFDDVTRAYSAKAFLLCTLGMHKILHYLEESVNKSTKFKDLEVDALKSTWVKFIRETGSIIDTFSGETEVRALRTIESRLDPNHVYVLIRELNHLIYSVYLDYDYIRHTMNK